MNPLKQWQLKCSWVSIISISENFVSKRTSCVRSLKENLGPITRRHPLALKQQTQRVCALCIYFIKEQCLLQDLPRVGNSQNTTKKTKTAVTRVAICALALCSFTFECLQRPALREDSPLTNRSGIHQLYR